MDGNARQDRELTLSEQIQYWLENTDEFRADEQRAAAEESLRSFVELTWPIIEPRRPMIPGRALDAICEHCEAVARGEITQLLINVPPGFSKSLVTNVFLPAWEWGPFNHPERRYISWSYSAELTLRDNRRCKRLIESPLYQRFWGKVFQISAEKNTESRYNTTETGWRVASSTGGLGTGERADRLNIDDPHNVNDVESDTVRHRTNRWFAESIATRINDEKASAITIMQRTHGDDVSNLILTMLEDWEWLCIPMEYETGRRCYTTVPRDTPPIRCKLVPDEIDPLPKWVEVDGDDPDGKVRWAQDWRAEDGELAWPERFSRNFLEKRLKKQMRAVGGDYAVASQFQQRPVPREGGEFRAKDFEYIDAAEVPTRKLRARVRGWDLAATGKKKAKAKTARTADVLMAIDSDNRVYVLDASAEHRNELQVEQHLEMRANADGPRVEQNIPQDPGQAGVAQKTAIARLLSGHNFAFSPESGDKALRRVPFAAQVKAHNVYLVRGPWNSGYVAEMCGLPTGLQDYGDSSSRGYARLLELTRPRSPIPGGPQVVEG